MKLIIDIDTILTPQDDGSVRAKTMVQARFDEAPTNVAEIEVREVLMRHLTRAMAEMTIGSDASDFGSADTGDLNAMANLEEMKRKHGFTGAGDASAKGQQN